MLIFSQKVYFVDKNFLLAVYITIFLSRFNVSKSITNMDKYIITLVLYLLLMISFKVYYYVNAKE